MAGDVVIPVIVGLITLIIGLLVGYRRKDYRQC